MGFSKLILLIVGICLAQGSHAFVPGACGGREIPPSKIRKIRNIRLECTSNSSQYFRGPEAFDYQAWADLERQGDREAMQALRQQAPLIEWSGDIPYQTVEVWEWTDWVYGHDSSCPTERVCTTRTVTDSEGRSRQEEECRNEPRPCWHDEDRYEERPCTSEVLSYRAHFVRPQLSEWNPKVEGYYDVLPNKYDLLPGESEAVQIFSSSSQATRLSPKLEVGDAWNQYQSQITFDNGSSTANCQMNTRYKIEVAIHTQNRLVKNTPNAFRMPVNRHGENIEPLNWLQAQGKKGDFVRSKPHEVRLSDSSSVLITALARQSRNFSTQLEAERLAAGVSTNSSQGETTQVRNETGFWKDTQVRVRLFEEVWLGRDRRKTHNLYTSGANVAMGEHYRIPIADSSIDSDLFRASGPISDKFWEKFRMELRPGRSYRMLISMFQKGVPFYKQECSGLGCMFGTEGHFSKELEIKFSADKNFDSRSWIQKFIDWQGEK